MPVVPALGRLRQEDHLQFKNRVKCKVSLSCCIIENLSQKSKPGVDEMAQQGKRLAAKTDDLSSIPSSHMVKGESCPLTSACAP